MTTSEPTTGENRDTECAIRALNTIAMVSPQWNDAIKVAADRLESQERKLNDYAPFEGLRDADAIDTDIIKHLMSNEKELRNWIVRASWHCAKVHTQSDEIAALTARAEQAETELDRIGREYASSVGQLVATAFRAEQAEKERDYLVESYVPARCSTCKHNTWEGCATQGKGCNWTWRGLPQDGEGK